MENRKKKKNKKFLIIFIIIFVIIIGLVLFTNIVSNNLEGIESIDDYTEDEATLYTVQNQDLSTYISGTGTISSDATVAITSILEGQKVSELDAYVGDTVTSGQKIAVIDVSSLKSDLTDLQNEYNLEKSTLQKAVEKANNNKTTTLASLDDEIDEAKKEYDKCVLEAEEAEVECGDVKTTWKTLVKSRTSTETELNEAISEAESARDASSKYPSQIKELQKKINASVIYAPSSGIITSLNITKGSVLAGSDIGVIQNSDDYKVSITVPEANILKVKVGMNVKLTVVATGDTVYKGTVTKVNKIPSASLSDDSSSGYKVEVSINDKNTELLIGMTAKCKIYINEVSDAIAVPYDAIMTDNEGKKYVYYIEQLSDTQYKITYKYVTVGVEGTYYTEIKEGLSKGDLVYVTSVEYDNGEVLSADFIDNNSIIVGDDNA